MCVQVRTGVISHHSRWATGLTTALTITTTLSRGTSLFLFSVLVFRLRAMSHACPHLTQTHSADYQDTLLAIQAYHRKIALPVHYYQLDSWWYYKGDDHGVAYYRARPDVFPADVEGLAAKLQGAC